jgi:hypothetical protein
MNSIGKLGKLIYITTEERFLPKLIYAFKTMNIMTGLMSLRHKDIPIDIPPPEEVALGKKLYEHRLNNMIEVKEEEE